MSEVEVVVGTEVFTVDPDVPITIGRSMGCDIQLVDPRVSRQHAKVKFAGGHWFLFDTSSGGTWLDGVPVAQIEITREVSVRLGTEGAPTITIRPKALPTEAVKPVVAHAPGLVPPAVPPPMAQPTPPTAQPTPQVPQPTPPVVQPTAPPIPAPPLLPPPSAPPAAGVVFASPTPGAPPLPIQPDSNGRPFYKKKRFIGAGVIGLVIAAAAISSNPGNDATDVQAVNTAGQTTQQEPEGAATTEPPPDEVEVQIISSSRDQPFTFDTAVAIEWDVLGDADKSIWNTTVGAPVDITAAVREENLFNDEPDEGFVFAAFPVSMTLAKANKEPLSTSFNFSFEVVGGETLGAYDGWCGVTPGDFAEFEEAYIGGTLTGTVCVPIPQADLDHPDTRVAFKFGSNSRQYFGPSGSGGAPIDVVPTPLAEMDQTEGQRANGYAYGQPIEITWDVLGDADHSVWTTTISQPQDITSAVKAENPFNDDPPEGHVFAGFDVTMVLVATEKEPLSVGFNLSFEIVGGATNIAYTTDCGVVPNEFDRFAEVFAGGSLTGTVCVSVPAEDLAHPNTRVALKFVSDSRAHFG